MDITQFFTALGLGGVLGIIVKAVFDRSIEKRRLLFEARVKAYAEITGRISNHFLEPDISKKSEALRFAQINAILSETYLVSGKNLKKLLDQYISKVNEMHNFLRDGDDKKIEKKVKELASLALEINKEMRKDLYL